MPFLPFRRRAPSAPPPAIVPDDLLATEAALRGLATEVLEVRDRQIRGGVIVFRGRLRAEPGRALDVLAGRFRPWGYTPSLRAEGGEVALHAWPHLEVPAPQRLGVNALLFTLTALSMLTAGWFYVGSPTFDALRRTPAWFLAGVPFAGTLLAILGVHEFGHYFMARHHRAAVSLPYFIPAPPPFPFGTLGAIIRMRSSVRDRNALFDIAAAGPLAGLAVAVPAIVLGLAWSSLAPRLPAGTTLVFGDSLFWSFLVWLRFGPIPDGLAVFTHPMADAAWAGFFVTAINLFPVGQLDGGRIAYALFGRRHRTVGIGAVVGMLVMGVGVLGYLMWQGQGFWEAAGHGMNWFVWAALILLLIGFHHGPPLDDVSPLTPGRRVVGLGCLVLMVLLVPPIPIG